MRPNVPTHVRNPHDPRALRVICVIRGLRSA
jgi:hypothetical protein